MVRGMLAIFILPLFKWFEKQPTIGTIDAGIYTGIIIMVITLIAAALTRETFHKDLDYLEE
jgi:putative MFS transporter